MMRYILLTGCLFSLFCNLGFSQGEIYGNCFYQQTSQRVVLRVAVRNNTNSTTGQMEFTGMRFGFQFNQQAVTYAGYTSYLNLHGNPGTGLEDAQFINFIGPDTGPNGADIDPAYGSSRVANVQTGGTKTMQMRYINRSTTLCSNTIPVNPGEIKILMDIYFTLNHNNPSYYRLLDADYGFGDPEFIAQFITKDNGGIDKGVLTDRFKEIALVVIRQGNTSNPYQPFDVSSCSNNNVSPITINASDINFISPIDGLLSCRFLDSYIQHASFGNKVGWMVCNNELLEKIAFRKRSGSGVFQTVSVLQAEPVSGNREYQFTDPVSENNPLTEYQAVLYGQDGSVQYSPVMTSQNRGLFVQELKLYPNPANDQIQFYLQQEPRGYQLRITDLMGKTWQSWSSKGGTVVQQVKSLPSGMYFLEAVQNGTDLKQLIRWVKN